MCNLKPNQWALLNSFASHSSIFNGLLCTLVFYSCMTFYHWSLGKFGLLSYVSSFKYEHVLLNKMNIFVNITTISISKVCKDWEALKRTVVVLFPKILIFPWNHEFHHWQKILFDFLWSDNMNSFIFEKYLPNTQVLKNLFVCYLIFQVKTVFHEKKEVV